MTRTRYRLAINGRPSICIVLLLVAGMATYKMASDLSSGCLGTSCSRTKTELEFLSAAYGSESKFAPIDHIEERQAHEHALNSHIPIVDSYHNASSLESRQAPWTDDYKAATKKGGKFICWMKDPASAGDKAVSKFTKHSDIEAQGWTRRQETVDYTHVTSGDYQSMIKMIGTDLSNGIKVRFDHDRDVGNYPATNGEYVNVYYPNHGIILANDNYGPESQIANGKASHNPWKDSRNKPLPIVQLRQWSDLTSLEYIHLSSSSPQNLRWIFRRNITNRKTQEMITKALQRKKSKQSDSDFKAKPWPGDMFEPGHEGFEALIATPNVSGVVWMLVQHEEEFGRKEIKSLRVWWDGKGVNYTPNLMVEVGDVLR